jgi:hypothetical protein
MFPCYYARQSDGALPSFLLVKKYMKTKKLLIFNLILLFFLNIALVVKPAVLEALTQIDEISVRVNAYEKGEILWLARLIYSETKVLGEMEPIAWVVRNRVETGFRGNSYEKVAQNSAQFSGLNEYDQNYEHNVSLTYDDIHPAWLNALSVAGKVFYAPEKDRMFPKTVRHFYSPIALAKEPSWAVGQEPYYAIESPVSSKDRFVFFDGLQ